MKKEDEMALTYKLIMKSGPEINKTFFLEKEEYTIGRELINDLIISDPEVSRKHARIFKKGEQYLIEDLGSTNGTFYSGRRITKPVPLKNGDSITLGKSVVVEIVAEEQVSQSVAEEKIPLEKQEGTKEIKKLKEEKSEQKSEFYFFPLWVYL